MKETQTIEDEKYMEQFVYLLKKDIENFKAEPEQMERFMSELSMRIEQMEGENGEGMTT